MFRRRQFGILYRDFLFRIVDRELLSTHAKGDASQLLLQIVTLLVFVSIALSIPALIVDFTGPVQARVMAAWSLEHFLIATTMLAVGVLAVLSWGAMFPDHRDVLVLAPLPIRARTILAAKLVAVITAFGVTIGTLHLVSGLVWPMVFNSRVHAATMLALTSDPPMAPVRATELQPVLDRDLDRAVQHGRLAAGAGGGVAIGIYQQGQQRIITYGAAGPTSLFQIGSVTKPFTGLVLAEMVETHQVSLNQPVRELIPDAHLARPAGPEITLLDLSTHHAGLPSMPQDYRPIDPLNPYTAFHVENLYAFLARHGIARRSDAPFAYSNVGFGLLGHALATRAGTDYAALVRQVVTGPLGLTDTVTELSPEQQQRFLQGYDDEQRAVRPWDFDEALAGAGALRSTAPDMLTWLEANLHPERVRPPALAAALFASHQIHATVNAIDLALAWMFHPDSGDYEHGGDTSNFTAYAAFNPQADLAVVVLSNVGPGTSTSADVVGQHILARLRGQSAVSLVDVAIPAAGGVRGWLRWSAAYWCTMIAAGLFVFGLAMGAQGIAAAVLPHRLFLRASSFLQLGAFVLIVGVYFLQPILVRPATVLAAQQGLGLSASPSYWFLGLFQALNGSPALGLLARNACITLGITLAGTTIAYGLSYVRTLRRIAEQPDINPGVTRLRWLPRFGARVETAVVHFSVRTLLRSAPHRVILAFYWGLGLACAAVAVKLPATQRIEPEAFAGGWQESSVPYLVSSVVVMCFAVLAARLAFAMPRDLRANWIFRTLPSRGGQSYGRGVRRALLAVSVTPVVAGAAIVFLSIWPWQPALGHAAALGLFGAVLAEIALSGAPRIPFTRSYLPGKSRVHIAAYIGLVLLLPLALIAARFERDGLQDRWTYGLMMAGLGICWIGAKWRNVWLSSTASTQPAFEDEPADQILTLDVWDSRFAAHHEQMGTPGKS